MDSKTILGMGSHSDGASSRLGIRKDSDDSKSILQRGEGREKYARGGQAMLGSKIRSISNRLNQSQDPSGQTAALKKGGYARTRKAFGGQMQQPAIPAQSQMSPFAQQPMAAQPTMPMKKGGGVRRKHKFLGALAGTLAPAAIDYVASGNMKRDAQKVGSDVSRSAQGWKKMLGLNEGGRTKKDFGGTMNKIGQGVKNIDGNVASAAKNVGNKIASGAKNFGSNVAKGAEVVGGHARNIGNKIAEGAKSFGKSLGFDEGGEVRKKRGIGGMMGRRMGMMQKMNAAAAPQSTPVSQNEMLTTKRCGGKAKKRQHHAMGAVGKVRKDEY